MADPILEWSMCLATKTHTATLAHRTFTINHLSSRIGYELWYGIVGRRLRVGIFLSVTEAKNQAEDLAASLLKIHQVSGE